MTYFHLLYFASYFWLWGCILWLLLVRPILPPWRGYNEKALHKLLLNFCTDKTVLTKLGPVIKQNSILAPVVAAFDSSTKTILIDTRQIRSKKALVKSFMHELCHANQYNQGRFRLGTKGNYWVRPIEQEARAFSRARSRIALRMYLRFERDSFS